MTPYDIIISELAEADVEAVFQRLLLRSPNMAVQFRNGIESAFASLAQMPRRCAIAPDNKQLEHPMRQLIYRQGATAYRILFSVFDAVDDASGLVRVLRVRHGAQQHLGLAAEQADED
jgi:plasmid stabilization system protein ParE